MPCHVAKRKKERKEKKKEWAVDICNMDLKIIKIIIIMTSWEVNPSWDCWADRMNPVNKALNRVLGVPWYRFGCGRHGQCYDFSFSSTGGCQWAVFGELKNLCTLIATDTLRLRALQIPLLFADPLFQMAVDYPTFALFFSIEYLPICCSGHPSKFIF